MPHREHQKMIMMMAQTTIFGKAKTRWTMIYQIIRQHVSFPVVATAVKINFYTDLDMIKKITFAIGVLVLAGCTATPEKVTTTKPVNPPAGTNTQKKK